MACEFDCVDGDCACPDACMNHIQQDIFLLHGFNVSDGGMSTVGKLLPFLPNSRVFPYGWLGVIGVYLFNDNIARTLSASLTDGCVVIGHSNAADIIYRALQLPNCPPVERVVLIRPALDCDVSFGDKVDRVDVFFHQGDVAVGLSKWLPFLGWGVMGMVGYMGDDLNVVNHDSEFLFDDSAHSSFANETLKPFVKYLRGLLGID